MNTTSRIENSGAPNRIHCSQEYADLLINAGKGKWLQKREDTVVAKGKGAMQTFWLTFGHGEGSRSHNIDDSTTVNFDETTRIEEVSAIRPQFSVKTERLIEWKVTVILQKLHDLVKQRNEGKGAEFQTLVTPEVEIQISKFVTEIALRYHQNPFHNFEHVCYTLFCSSVDVCRSLTYISSHISSL